MRQRCCLDRSRPMGAEVAPSMLPIQELGTLLLVGVVGKGKKRGWLCIGGHLWQAQSSVHRVKLDRLAKWRILHVHHGFVADHVVPLGKGPR